MFHLWKAVDSPFGRLVRNTLNKAEATVTTALLAAGIQTEDIVKDTAERVLDLGMVVAADTRSFISNLDEFVESIDNKMHEAQQRIRRYRK